MSNNSNPNNPWNKNTQHQDRGSTSNRGLKQGGSSGRGGGAPPIGRGGGRGRGEFKPRQFDQTTPNVTPNTTTQSTSVQPQNTLVQPLHQQQTPSQNTVNTKQLATNGTSQPFNPINRGGGKITPVKKPIEVVPQINRTSSAPPNIGELEAHSSRIFIPEKGGFVNTPAFPQPQQSTQQQQQQQQPSSTTSGPSGQTTQNHIPNTSVTTGVPKSHVPHHVHQPYSSVPFYPQSQPYNPGFFPQHHHNWNPPTYFPSQQTTTAQSTVITRRAKSSAIQIADPTTGKSLTIQQLLEKDGEKKGDQPATTETKSSEIKEEPKKEEDNLVEKVESTIEKKEEEKKPSEQNVEHKVEPKTEAMVEELSKTQTKVEELPKTEAKVEELPKVEEPPKTETKVEELKPLEQKVEAPKVEPPKTQLEEEKTEKLAPINIKKEEESDEDNGSYGEEDEEDEEYDEEDYEEEYDEEEEKEEEEEELPSEPQVKKKLVYSKEELLKYQHSSRNPPPTLLKSEIYQTQISSNANNNPLPRTDSSGNFNKYPGKSPRTPSPKGHQRQGSKGSADLSHAPHPGGFKQYFEDQKAGRTSKRGRERGKKSAGRGRAPVELKVGEHAWQAGKVKSEEDKIYQEVHFVLNRLTREKYDALKQELLAIKIPSEEVLKKVIEEMFEKAIMEPNFSDLYADLCKDLSQEFVAEGNEAGIKKEAFKRILLNKCQDEFEKEKEREKKTTSTEKLAQMSTEEREYEEGKLRRRMIGNIVFIGELFKQGMLSEKIMHEVIRGLLMKTEPPTEADIEVLCKLVTTIGKKLDHDKAIKVVQLYFVRMQQLAVNKEYSSRIRFMLQDVIELRQNNWEPRIKVAKSKTIKEVREEAKKEKVKQERETSQRTKKYDRDRQAYPDDRGTSRGRGGSVRGMPRTGSETRLERVQNKGRERYQSMHPSANKDTRLGPPGSFKDSRTTGSTPSKTTKLKTDGEIVTQNAFSALQEDEKQDEFEEDPVEEEEEEETERSGEEDGETSNEKIEDNALRVIKDFLEEGDTDEAIKDYNGLGFDGRQAAYFIKKSIDIAFEKKEDEQNEISKLLKTLKSEVETVTEQSFERGFDLALHNVLATELYIDIPRAFPIYASILGRALFDRLISFDAVFELLRKYIKINEDTLLTGNQAIEILVGIGKKLAQELEISDDNEKKELLLRLNESSFNVLHIFDLTHSKQLKKYAEETRASKIDDLDVSTKIFGIVVRKEDPNTALKWLHDTFGEEKLSTSTVITSKVVCSVICGIESTDPTMSEHEEEELFNKYAPVLSTVLKSSGAQLHALFEIQYYCYSQEEGRKKDSVLRLFKLFKEKGWISSTVFNQWKNDTENKTPGKEGALSKVSSLF
jgi:translation initiation factor 4G